MANSIGQLAYGLQILTKGYLIRFAIFFFTTGLRRKLKVLRQKIVHQFYVFIGPSKWWWCFYLSITNVIHLIELDFELPTEVCIIDLFSLGQFQ